MFKGNSQRILAVLNCGQCVCGGEGVKTTAIIKQLVLFKRTNWDCNVVKVTEKCQ